MRYSIIAGAAVIAAAGALTYALQVDRPAVVDSRPRVVAELERTLSLGDSSGRQPRFSNDSKLLALTNAAGGVYLLRTSDWRLLRRFQHEGGATAAAFSRDGKTLYTVGYDGVLRSWGLATGQPGGTIKASNETVWTLDISPDGKRLATAGEDGTARVWNLEDLRQPPIVLRGHQRNIWEARFSPAAPQLATGSFDYQARIWDLASAKTVRHFRGHRQAVVGLDYRPDGQVIASSGDDSTIRLWRVADARELRTIHTGNHTYNVDFSPDGQWLASAGRSRSALGTLIYGWTGLGRGTPPVHIWRVADGALVAALPQPTDVFQLAYAPDGQHVVTSDDEGRVRIWRVTPG